MHLWRLLPVILLFAASAAGAAVIYKWTDTDGVVHFSDQPIPGAERIVISGTSSHGISVGSSTAPADPSPRQTGARPGLPALTIESPAQEQVFFNDDVVPVRLHVEPALQASQSVVWKLNGKTLSDEPPASVSFALQNLPRGTYVVSATVVDSMTDSSQSAAGVTFYVKQPTELAPQHQKH